MSAGDSLDVLGAGKALEAIPDSAWNTLVSTACTVFEKSIAPITETSSGLGRYIRQKFDNMVEVERVLFADGLERAVRKAKQRQKPIAQMSNLDVLSRCIDAMSRVNESTLRELWANLVANQLTEDSVHPEFVLILERLGPRDVHGT